MVLIDNIWLNKSVSKNRSSDTMTIRSAYEKRILSRRDMIKIKRIYEEYSSDDGVRILVDRLWPRGISKEKAKIDIWYKDIAPTNDLRKWFNHDIEKYEEFKEKYFEELKGNPLLPDFLDLVSEKSKSSDVTLLFSAKDEEHNNAVVLKEFLENRHII